METMEIMDTMDTFLLYIRHNGRNGRYKTQWTPSPLDGVQEVGGSNPLAPTGFGLSQESPFYKCRFP